MILTIDVLFNEWFEYKKKRVKPTTIGTYRTNYQNHIRKCFLGADMSRGVNNEVMQTFVEILLSQGLSVKSAQDSKIVLSNIMKYAGRKYGTPVFAYQIEYPTKNMKLSQQIQFFSKEQCKRIFQEMEENPSLPLLGLVIGLTTGMRIGEICGLRFSDIDLGVLEDELPADLHERMGNAGFHLLRQNYIGSTGQVVEETYEIVAKVVF